MLLIPTGDATQSGSHGAEWLRSHETGKTDRPDELPGRRSMQFGARARVESLALAGADAVQPRVARPDGKHVALTFSP